METEIESFEKTGHGRAYSVEKLQGGILLENVRPLESL
jgi:hypothetical protein